MAIFTRDQIQLGLKRLGELAAVNGLQIRLALVGGAAMVLGYNARQSTKDIDAVIVFPAEARLVRNLVKIIASELDWPEDWLNDGAKGYAVGISEGSLLFKSPGIEAYSLSIEQAFAMKLCAWRDDIDISDARLLLQQFNPEQGKEVIWARVEPFLVPGDELTAQYAYLDLWESLYGTD